MGPGRGEIPNVLASVGRWSCMRTPDSPDTGRKLLAHSDGELFAVIKQLQAVRTAAQDPNGESFGLLIARLAEADERLQALVEQSRGVIQDTHE